MLIGFIYNPNHGTKSTFDHLIDLKDVTKSECNMYRHQSITEDARKSLMFSTSKI